MLLTTLTCVDVTGVTLTGVWTTSTIFCCWGGSMVGVFWDL